MMRGKDGADLSGQYSKARRVLKQKLTKGFVLIGAIPGRYLPPTPPEPVLVRYITHRNAIWDAAEAAQLGARVYVEPPAPLF